MEGPLSRGDATGGDRGPIGVNGGPGCSAYTRIVRQAQIIVTGKVDGWLALHAATGARITVQVSKKRQRYTQPLEPFPLLAEGFRNRQRHRWYNGWRRDGSGLGILLSAHPQQGRQLPTLLLQRRLGGLTHRYAPAEEDCSSLCICSSMASTCSS
ncbi:MAG: hypothetical protein ABW185_09585, partial [Sedimenticola sp.]